MYEAIIVGLILGVLWFIEKFFASPGGLQELSFGV